MKKEAYAEAIDVLREESGLGCDRLSDSHVDVACSGDDMTYEDQMRDAGREHLLG